MRKLGLLPAAEVSLPLLLHSCFDWQQLVSKYHLFLEKKMRRNHLSGRVCFEYELGDEHLDIWTKNEHGGTFCYDIVSALSL